MQPGALQQFAPVVLADGVDGGYQTKRRTATARLTGGGAVVLWAGPQLMAQKVDAAGNAVGASVVVASAYTNTSVPVAVTATPDGGWIAAWDSASRAVQAQRFGSTGAAIGTAITVDATAFSQVDGVQVLSAADNTFVVAWAATDTSASPDSRAYLRRFAADGSAITDRVAISSTDGAQTDVRVALRPDGTLIAGWIQHNPARQNVASVRTLHLDAQLSPLGADQLLEAEPDATAVAPARPFELSLATLASGATLAAWGETNSGAILQVRWQVLDASGAPTLATTNSSAISLQRSLDTVEAVPDGTGFLIAAASSFWWFRGGYGYATLLNVSAGGSLLSQTELGRGLNDFSDVRAWSCGPAASGVAAAGGEDGHYVLAYEQCAVRTDANPVVPADVMVEAR